MTAGHGSKRSQQEDTALAALLVEPTIAEAATKAGVSASTLYRWLSEPAFQTRYRAARRQVVEQAICGLQRATIEAVDALRRNLTCGLPAAEITAAKSVIDFSVKGIELMDLVQRVEQLEQAAAGVVEREKRTR